MFKLLKFVKTMGRIFTIWIYCIDSNKYSGSPKSHRMLYYFFNFPATTKFLWLYFRDKKYFQMLMLVIFHCKRIVHFAANWI